MILDEETGRVNVEELNTLGSRQLVTRDVVRLSFPPFCTPSSLSPLFRRSILLFSPLPSPWFSPQTLILLHIYLYAPPSPHVFKVAPLWIMSHVHVCVFPLSIYTHVSLLSNKWILCWRGWRCLPELCFEARDTDEKIRKVQLVRIGFQELPIARTISLLIDYRSSYNTSSRVYTWYKNFVEFQCMVVWKKFSRLNERMSLWKLAHRVT